MKVNFKRTWAGVAALAVAASTVLVFGTGTAYAAGTPAGAATVKNANGAADLNSGNGATTFTLRLPTGASCPGDSANDGYRWQTYMVPASVDPSTLQFDAAGPTPGATGANFRQPLYAVGFSPVVDQQTANATTPPGPGPIINIPNMNYEAFAPGDIPAGAYNIGIACTLGPPSATQMKDFWNVTKTFTAGGGGAAAVNWSVGAVPAAPVLTTVTPGDGQLTAAFTHAASTPATTGYTVTATPPSGPAVTGTGATSPVSVTGLTNGTAYSVTVRATNSVGSSAESNAVSGTPAIPPRPPVTNLTATPGTGKVTLNWTNPTSGPTPTGYLIGTTAGTVTGANPVPHPGTSAEITGLTAGTVYTFTVTPQHSSGPAGTAATTSATPLSAQVLVQDVTVTRPTGTIVLTQICGKNGAIPADTSGTVGFPSGSLPLVPADTVGTAPTTGAGPGGPADPVYGEYPYPENPDGTPNPTYPTHCGINLGNAKLIKNGTGRGQFFAASGVLNQVTVVDTRDTDTAWGITGTMSTFTKTGDATKTFSGSQLGWSPVMTDDSDAFTDSNGVSYDQLVLPGPVVLPNSLNAVGLSTGRTLGSAAGLAGTAPNFTGALGIAELDARLKLLIPITAVSGVYTGTLTMTVA